MEPLINKELKSILSHNFNSKKLVDAIVENDGSTAPIYVQLDGKEVELVSAVNFNEIPPLRKSA